MNCILLKRMTWHDQADFWRPEHLLTMLAVVTPSLMALQPSQPPIERFEETESVPASERLPAAPLVKSVYALAWLMVFFYVWTAWRRLNKVEIEMRSLAKRQRH